MNELEAWIADCHLLKVDGEGEFRCQAAVWSNSADEFRVRLDKYLAGGGYNVLWLEECLPANQYIARHGQQQKVGRLARVVQEHHLVELSQMVSLNDDVEIKPESYLVIEESEGVEPLDLQMGVHPTKAVPDALIEPIFGQPAPSDAEIETYGSVEDVPPLKTYAILDAAKVLHLPMLVDSSDLTYRCLFKGDAAKELKNVAPYLIELEYENTFTRDLFTSAGLPSNMWDKEPGIYIRSRADFDVVWSHFRKFTRVQGENGKWYYFRFWEGTTICSYAKSIQANEMLSGALIYNREQQVVYKAICIKGGVISTLHGTPSLRQGEGQATTTLPSSINAIFREERQLQQYKDISDRLAKKFPDQATSLGREKLESVVKITSNRFQSYGFSQLKHIYLFTAWAIFYGSDFELKDNDGTLIKIAKGPELPHIRFEKFSHRMAELRVSKPR